MSNNIKRDAQKTETKRGSLISRKPKKTLSQTKNKNSPVEQVLHLQRIIGNRAVNRLIQSGTIQAKLTIGKPNTIYEKEADRVADRVMSMKDGSLVNGHSSLAQRESTCPECPERKRIQSRTLAEAITPLAQRQVEEEEEPQAKPLVQRQNEEEEEKSVQSKAAPQQGVKATPSIESSIDSMKGGGQPLSESSRAFYEPRFGADFSHVRIHTGSRAAQTAQAINARAFTLGKNIVFNSGQYSPGTSSGKHLLAHELTHVVQQRGSTIGRIGEKRIFRKRPTQTVTPSSAACGNSYGAKMKYCYSGAKNWWFKEKVKNASGPLCQPGNINQTTTPIQSSTGCVIDKIYNNNGPPSKVAPCTDTTYQTVYTGPTKADVEKYKYNNTQVIEVTVNKGSKPKSGKVTTTSAGVSTDCNW